MCVSVCARVCVCVCVCVCVQMQGELEFVRFDLNKNSDSFDLTTELAAKSMMKQFLTSLLKVGAHSFQLLLLLLLLMQLLQLLLCPAAAQSAEKAARVIETLKQGKEKGSLVCRIEMKCTKSCWGGTAFGSNSRNGAAREDLPVQLRFNKIVIENSDVVIGAAQIEGETLVFTGVICIVCMYVCMYVCTYVCMYV